MNINYPLVEATRIKFANDKIAEFPYEIEYCLSFRNVFVVMLKVPLKTTYNENVFGLSIGGEIIWRIEKAPYQGTRSDCPYTHIVAINDNEANLFNWCDINVRIEAQSGKILDYVITK